MFNGPIAWSEIIFNSENRKQVNYFSSYLYYLPTYLPTYQCDQMIRLFFNICPLATKNSPILYQIFQSRLNICQKLVKFCQSCLFSPNLVTLLPTYLPAYLTWVWRIASVRFDDRLINRDHVHRATISIVLIQFSIFNREGSFDVSKFNFKVVQNSI